MPDRESSVFVPELTPTANTTVPTGAAGEADSGSSDEREEPIMNAAALDSSAVPPSRPCHMV
eukprot:scaffold329404_cov75-Tisochrysis_lutea.AAC.1